MQKIFWLLVSLSVIGCGQDKVATKKSDEKKAPVRCEIVLPLSGLCANLEWDAPPQRKTVRNAKLVFTQEADGKVVDPETNFAVGVAASMPEMTHPVTQPTLERNADGTYQVKQLKFTMAGLWEVRIRLTHKTLPKTHENAYRVRL